MSVLIPQQQHAMMHQDVEEQDVDIDVETDDDDAQGTAAEALLAEVAKVQPSGAAMLCARPAHAMPPLVGGTSAAAIGSPPLDGTNAPPLGAVEPADAATS